MAIPVARLSTSVRYDVANLINGVSDVFLCPVLLFLSIRFDYFYVFLREEVLMTTKALLHEVIFFLNEHVLQ